MTPQDAVRYRPIVQCALSDDGRWAAAAVPSWDPERDARPLSVLLRDLDGSGRWERLAGPEPPCMSPTFAPDSRRLAAIRAPISGPEAVWFDLEDLRRSPKLLAGAPGGVTALKWRGRPGDPACIGEAADGWRRVWAWSDPTEPPRPLTPEGVHVADYAFRPDGQRLAWVHIPHRDAPEAERLPIHVADGDGAGAVEVRVPGRPVGFLAWSPDGRWLAYMARSAGFQLTAAKLWIVDPARWPGDPDAARCLTREMGSWVTGFDWSPEGDALVVATVEGTYGRLYRVGLDGAFAPVGPRRTYLSGPHVDRARGRLLHLHQDGDRPQRLCLLEPGARRSRGLTRFNRRLHPDGPCPAETVRWTAADGLGLDGLLVRPRNQDAPAPLLVWLHGGPAEGVARTYSPYFQVFAQAGFAVFAPNYRGSSGHGDGFLRANVGDLGGADVEDVLSGVDRLVQMEVAYSEGTAVVGWSYGGTLALHLARRSAVPSALVVGAPVVDWVSFFGAPRLPGVYREYFPSPLWEDRGPFDAASPITGIGDVNAPTLVLHGSADGVVPVSQSRLLYRALKGRGVETDLMIYPGGGHVLTRPSEIVDMLGRILRWCAPRVGLPS